MATADLKIVYGSGGNIKASLISGGLSISPGSSGVLLTITPPAGKLVILTSLTVIAGGLEPNIKITANGSTLITGGVSSSAQGGGFSIGYSMGTGVGNGAPNIVFPPIISTTPIIIEKTTGSTVSTLYYGYMYGD